MALSRTAVVLLLMPAPAAVYLATATEDVNASGQCLPSAEAVHQQYPGAWASWTMQAANHKGERCWFPAMRENHARHIEAALRRTAQKLMHRDNDKDAQSEGGQRGVGAKAPAEKPVAFAAEMNQLGWSFHTRSANVGPAGISGVIQTEDSSFEDRFAAARNVNYVQKPSLIQRMMDPVGAIPNIP